MKYLPKKMVLPMALISLILVFNIHGYLTIQKKVTKNKGLETASDFLRLEESLTDDIVQKIVFLTVHSSAQQELHVAQLERMRDSLHTSHTRFHHYAEEHKDELAERKIFFQAGLQHDSLLAQVETILDNRDVLPWNDFDYIGRVRANHNSMKKAFQSMATQLEALERKGEDAAMALSIALIVSLVAAMVLVCFLLLAPSIRSNNKNLKEKLEALKQVEESENRYRNLFNNNPLPIWIVSRENLRILQVNDRAISRYGYSQEEFCSMTLDELLPAVDLESNQGPAIIAGIHTHITKNGKTLFIELISHPIEYKNTEALMVLANDITRQVQLQNELVEEKIVRQKEITQAIIDTQEKERSEIGKELHDNVNQVLTTIKLYIENISAWPDQSGVFIDKSIALTQRAINEIRFLAKQLVTPVLHDLGFKASIDELIAHCRSLQLFDIELQFLVEEESLPTTIKLTIYRIIQEQLNNVVKYAQASLVQVSIAEKPGAILVRVHDNGIGFDPGIARDGIGLKNIRNRAEAYQGTIILKTAEGKGCLLEVNIPFTRILKTTSAVKK